MKKIFQLSDQIIAKIAAGEVIERPAFAVKELIENSIDAKADDIRIELQESGLKRIAAHDNGIGMSREDMEECYKPHTTSKLKDEHELHAIKSLGFRGEALASIAAISHMIIRSRQQDEVAGTEVELHAGVVDHISPVGRSPGTSIIVDEIFSTVPARKKFLKSDRTELRHITDIVINYAMIHPSISFHLTHNGKVIIDLPKTEEASVRIQTILGDDIFQHMVPYQHEDSYVKIHGYISKPQLTTQQGSKQFLFVNQRAVSDRYITTTIKETYGSLLEPPAFPMFVMFLSLPFEHVDVNVHPRKEQIAFIDSEQIYSHIRTAVKDALKKHNLTFSGSNWLEQLVGAKADTKITHSYAGMLLREQVTTELTYSDSVMQKEADIIQLHHVYIVTQTRQGILLIDQHAAHERILYNRFEQAFEHEKQKLEQVVQSPSLRLSLNTQQLLVLEEYRDVFERLGFEFQQSDKEMIILAIPVLLKDRNIPVFICEVLDDIVVSGGSHAIDRQTKKMLAFLACRSAIKAGDTLTKDQCRDLVNTLEQTDMAYTCPHGRPVKIEVHLRDVHRIFKRM